MKPICRFLFSCAILAIAVAPLILLAVFLVDTHPSGGWWIGVLLGCCAEWYRLVENRRQSWVERLLPGSRPRRERAAFLDRSVLHWRYEVSRDCACRRGAEGATFGASAYQSGDPALHPFRDSGLMPPNEHGSAVAGMKSRRSGTSGGSSFL